MINRICLFAHHGEHEAQHLHVHQLAQHLAHRQITTKIVEVTGGRLPSNLIKEINNFSPDLLCSFHQPLPQGERFFWEALAIPHLSIVSTSAYYSTALTSPPHSIIACTDRNDVATFSSLPFSRLFFLPHAIDTPIIPQSNNHDRPYDVVLFGNCYDYEHLRTLWQQRYPLPIQQLLDHAIDIATSNATLPIAEALTQAWATSHLSPQQLDFLSLYTFLDHYIRGKEQIELIRSIKNAKIHIFGDMAKDTPIALSSWSHYLSNKGNVTISPSVSFNKMLQIIGEAKILLHSHPSSRNGSNELVLLGFACETLPITTPNIYLTEEFGNNLPLYQPNNKQEIDQQISSWLVDTPKRQHAIEQGKQKVLQHHTLAQRVDELLETIPPMIQQIHHHD